MISIGIDFGGTKSLAVAFDAQLQPLSVERVATPLAAGREAMLDALVALVDRLRVRHGAAAAVGVGFAGLVDRTRGIVDSSVILPGFDDFPLASTLAHRLAAPVLLENDATAAGYGEWIACGRRREDLLVVTVGTGIGGAVVLDGQLRRGASGVAGEFGNMTIDWHGAEHGCGNRGCLNTLASGTAMLAHARSLSAECGMTPPTDLAQVAAAAAAGDSLALAVVERGARALGAGLANLTMAFNPHRIALMGGVLRLGDAWLAAVIDEAAKRSFPRAVAALSIAPCRLGDHTGALGAAALATEALSR